MKKNINIVLTARDMEIFKLINKVYIIKGSFIYKIITNDLNYTKQKEKIFKYRLKKLRTHWYLDVINNDKSIIWEFIYKFNTKKNNLDRIENFIWEEVNIKKYLNISHSLYYHTLYISYWIYYIKKILNDKKDIQIWINNIVSEDQVKKWIEKESKDINTKYVHLDKHMIPDAIINVAKTSFCIEIELKSWKNVWKIEKKMSWYKNMQYFLWNDNFSAFLKEKVFICIFTNKDNFSRYQKIIKEKNLSPVKNISIKLFEI